MERATDALEIEPLEDRHEPAEPRVTEHDVVTTTIQGERDEEGAEGGEPVFAPTDPVLEEGGREVVGGFGSTSMDDLTVDPSTIDEEPGDEAVADAVRRELNEDATTAHLALDVQVRGGVVYLRGAAEDLEDADNAADVASRVPGVDRVVERMTTPET